MLNKLVDILTKFPMLFLQGTGMTIALSAVCVLLGVLLGTLVAMLRMSRRKPLRAVALTYIEIIRGTPIYLQLLIFVFGLPTIGVSFPSHKLTASVIALALNSGAYVAEIVRSGIQAVDSGQTEAARSLGMPGGMAMRLIILPQAVKNILPALGNEFIMLVKESSLVSTFFLGDLMTVQKTITGVTYTTMEPLLICGVIYFIITFSLSRLLGVFERRLKQSD